MVGARPVVGWLTAVIICCGIVVWLGLSLFGFTMIFQGEGSYSSSRQLLIVLMDVFLALGCSAMVASLSVLRRPPKRRRLPVTILAIVSAQLAVLFTGLVELFAYYPWIGAMAIAAALVVVILMLARLLGHGRTTRPTAAGPAPPR
jgi:peptidoglycan/LPS O-acetylase OafA/YrhL